MTARWPLTQLRTTRSDSSARTLANVGAGLAVYQVGQVVWVLLASRVLDTRELAAVLTAQAVFNVLFLLVDNGTAYWGARAVAAGELGASERASLVRVRLQLAVLAGVCGLAICWTGGVRTAAAFAPYAGVLVLVALLNVWERWGRGDARPLSVWLCLRGGGLAMLGTAFHLAAADLPVWVPGLLEGAVVLLVAAVFRLSPLRHLRAALRADSGPWRSTTQIGAPALLGQLGLAGSVVMLNAAGPVAAAAVLAVALRVLSGLNNGAALLTGSLFPRLARLRPGQVRGDASQLGGLANFMQLSIVAIGAGSAALGSLAHGPIVRALADVEASVETVALVPVLAATAALGVSVNLTAILVAGHREAEALRATLVGCALTLLASGVVVAVEPVAVEIWMGCAVLGGLILTAGLLALATRRLSSDEQLAARRGLAGACLVGVLVAPVLVDGSLAAVAGGAQLALGGLAAYGAGNVLLGLRRGGPATLPRAGWPAHRAGHRGPGLRENLLVAAAGAVLCGGAACAIVFGGQDPPPGVTAAVALLLAAGIVLVALRTRRLLSPPVMMGVPLLVGLAAAMSPTTRINHDWSGESLAIAWGIALAPLAGMAAVAFVARAATTLRGEVRDVVAPKANVIVGTCVAMVAVGVAVQVYEFARFGAIPLFSSSIDADRVAFGSTGPLHLLSDGLTLSAIIAAWARFGWAERFTEGQRRLLMAMIVFVPLFLTLQGGRFVATAPAIAAFVAARPYLSSGAVRRVGVIALSLVVVLSVALLGVRFSQDVGSKSPLTQRTFLDDAGARQSPPVALWRGLVVNLGEGYRVADEFHRAPFTLPKPSTSVYFADRVFSEAQDPEAIALELTDLWITSTYAGPVLLDLGVAAALLWGALLGALLQWVWVRRSYARGPLFFWLYAYLAAHFAFLFYVELPTQLPFMWIDVPVIVALAVLLVPRPGRAAARRPVTLQPHPPLR